MKRIAIKPVWTIQEPGGPPMPTRLLELLAQVHAQGSLLAACQQLGLSYRHGWELVRQGEAHFGSTLLHMERGKGSTLSALGEKLVWADHRISARLAPVLDTLASELAGEISRVLDQQPPTLRLQASHGFAIEKLVDRLGADGIRIDRKYGSSTEAVAALHDQACDLAGLHVPFGPLQDGVLTHYRRWLNDADYVLIDIATRWQGLMVAPGNPKKIHALHDLLRPPVRFINRQAGSGTRLLLEGLLRQQGIAASAIAGFEQGEFTHAAVAAFVASGMADLGFGLEPPARQFRLDFLPLASERYFLLCRAERLQDEALQRVVATLRDPALHAVIDALPGYQAASCGRITPLAEAFGPLNSSC